MKTFNNAGCKNKENKIKGNECLTILHERKSMEHYNDSSKHSSIIKDNNNDKDSTETQGALKDSNSSITFRQQQHKERKYEIHRTNNRK